MEFLEIANVAEVLFINDPLKHYLWAYLLIGALGFGILYVFQSVALYTIAVRDGYENKWMAFVPVLNTYYIGVVSNKNKIFNRIKPKYCSMAMAILEGICLVLGILYYVANFKIFGGGYAEAVYTPIVSMGTTIDILDGYVKVDNFPVELEWAWWMAMSMPLTLTYWFELAYNLVGVFVLVSFFRTYSSPRYFIFVILSVLFPIQGIFMFAVRNNRGKNYGDYLREQQQRQFRMFQEYKRNYENGYGGGYGGQYGQGNPYDQGRQSTPPEDPFGGLGDSNGQNRQGNYNGGGDSGNSGNGSGNAHGSDDPFDL